MMVGMAVLGLPFRAVLGSLGYTRDEAFARFPEIDLRRHDVQHSRGDGRVDAVSRPRLADDGGDDLRDERGDRHRRRMFWLHIVSEEPLIGLMHVLMLPAMLAAMLLRREEYAHAHR